jgi:hypothetical protein
VELARKPGSNGVSDYAHSIFVSSPRQRAREHGSIYVNAFVDSSMKTGIGEVAERSIAPVLKI